MTTHAKLTLVETLLRELIQENRRESQQTRQLSQAISQRLDQIEQSLEAAIEQSQELKNCCLDGPQTSAAEKPEVAQLMLHLEDHMHKNRINLENFKREFRLFVAEMQAMGGGIEVRTQKTHRLLDVVLRQLN